MLVWTTCGTCRYRALQIQYGRAAAVGTAQSSTVTAGDKIQSSPPPPPGKPSWGRNSLLGDTEGGKAGGQNPNWDEIGWALGGTGHSPSEGSSAQRRCEALPKRVL